MTERAKTRLRTATDISARIIGVRGSEDAADSMAHVGEEG